MNESIALDPSNWYAPAGLFIQFAFLVAGVWFARNALRTIKAFQDQVEAILKLSITGAVEDRRMANPGAPRSLAEGNRYWLSPPETGIAGLPEQMESGPSRLAVARRRMIQWLQAPMRGPVIAPWRRVMTWLQAPAGS